MQPDSPHPAQVRRNDSRHRYEIEVQGRLAGFLDYREEDGTLALVHTEVLDGFEGQGLGAQLARRALEDAREQGRQVDPSCSFVASYVARHPQYADLVAH